MDRGTYKLAHTCVPLVGNIVSLECGRTTRVRFVEPRLLRLGWFDGICASPPSQLRVDWQEKYIRWRSDFSDNTNDTNDTGKAVLPSVPMMMYIRFYVCGCHVIVGAMRCV